MPLLLSLVFLITVVAGVSRPVWADSSRPNILWLTSEDNGPQLGCYGDAYADTPNLDVLAARSLRYDMCWSNAPVCAPARTTLITGMYANSLGGQHMRSAVEVPLNVRLYPQLFRDAGYYCTNRTKTDYNLIDDKAGWHDTTGKAHWRNRPNKQTPFFAIFNSTISHESKIRVRPHTAVHDPKKAPVPSYHPDRPEVRRDWAQYYDKMTAMDRELGKVLDQLREDGLDQDTIVFYYGDHGSGMPRSKRWPYNSGLQVPFVLHIPKKFEHLRPRDYAEGASTPKLASFVDMAPTALAMCGIDVPESMQGCCVTDDRAESDRDYVFGFRGRMDERIDMVRSCTDGRYVYMMHFYPDRPYLKYVDYMFQTPTTRLWKELFDAGELNAVQSQVWQNKPFEQLHDLQSDPDEVVNLADAPEHAKRLVAMRAATVGWMKDILDVGVYPEHDLHELSGDEGPRSYAVADADQTRRLIDTAVACMSGTSSSQVLIDQLIHDDAMVRYWAVRGLAIQTEKTPVMIEALQSAMNDDATSVAIAAADALVRVGDASLQRAAIDRLIRLANADQTSQYAALAALNSLDMNATLTSADIKRIGQLPKRATPPPKRVEKYVGALLAHIIGS